jgi:hypothetical protein
VLNKLIRTALKLMSSSISVFFEVVFHFHFFLSRFDFFGRPWWVKIRLHTENQLPRLPQSALKVPGWWWWWVPNHNQVKLMLGLIWAVTIIVPSSLPRSLNALLILKNICVKFIKVVQWSNGYSLDRSP